MTEIIALGTGSAFTMKGHQTNFLVKRNGKYLLIDCGTDIRFSLQKVGLSFKDIDAVYISHAHADHIGGMEYLGFTRYFTRKAMIAAQRAGQHEDPLPLPTLFCERGLVRTLWDHSLRGGMEGLEGIDADIDTYFNVHPVDKNGSFEWEGLTFDMVQSLHISAKYCIVDSFGLMFDDIDSDPDNYSEPRRVFITTDVQFAPETAMKAYYEESDVIIHDCETMYKSGVHAHYDDLKTLKPEVKAKMRLIHYQDNVLDDWDSWQSRATKEDGFYGFLKPGVVYASDEKSFNPDDGVTDDDVVTQIETGLAALEFSDLFASCKTESDLRAANASIMGIEGEFTQLLKLMSEVPADKRRMIGSVINAAREKIETAFKDRLDEIQAE